MRRKKFDIAQVPANVGKGVDDRFQAATPLRALLNKVFPDHWSFLLGEIALFSFIVLLLTGTFLTLFFDPSMQEVVYRGSYTRLQGIPMSRAYESTLDLSFDVRGGLIMRQMHHWAALMFMAAPRNQVRSGPRNPTLPRRSRSRQSAAASAGAGWRGRTPAARCR